MKRKLIRQGTSTLTISLPNKWVEKNSLNAGDEVNINEIENTLELFLDKTHQRNEINKRINFEFKKADNRYIKWILSAAQKVGYDEIIISYKDESVLKIINSLIGEVLVGFEILETSKNRCLIKNITKETPEEFERIYRRLYLVTLSMTEQLHEMLASKEYGRLGEISYLEKTSNKLTCICHRIINKKILPKEEKQIFNYLIIWNLESIGDIMRDMSNFIFENKLELSNDTLTNFLELNKIFRQIYESHYNYRLENFIDLHARKKEFIKRLQDSTSDPISHYLFEYLQRLMDFPSSIISLNLDK